MKTLREIIENLKARETVDAVLFTGSQGTDYKPYSDIDLIVILKKNNHDLRSLYTWIEGKFSDVFFFDRADIERIQNLKEIPANNMDGVLVSWLLKATIQFDKSGAISKFKEQASELSKHLVVPTTEKDSFHQKVNYNFVANTRYYNSQNPIYREALELRLLYSTIEVFTAYFEFRNIPWRGEKIALKYLRENEPDFYGAFQEYTRARSVDERFTAYEKLVDLVFPKSTTKWKEGDVLPQPKTPVAEDKMNGLVAYWNDLIN